MNYGYAGIAKLKTTEIYQPAHYAEQKMETLSVEQATNLKNWFLHLCDSYLQTSAENVKLKEENQRLIEQRNKIVRTLRTYLDSSLDLRTEINSIIKNREGATKE